MRQFLYTSVMTFGVFFGSFAGPAQADDVTFLSVLTDVPLMNGLTEKTETALYFETPEGRIVKAFATGPVTDHALRDYYQQSLPALGWHMMERHPALRFKRDQEILQVTPQTKDAALDVSFTVSPARP